MAAIVGPTASGKSDLALALARRLPVEILVADSRQVYRRMDIGTAKPDAAARASVPHHLIDLVDPDEPFTVARWLDAARSRIAEIAARGRLPLLVGGTGLYVTALVDGYDIGGQPTSPEVRDRLERESGRDGLAALAARLEAADPRAAAHTDLRNPRRVLRALERAEAGGGGADPGPHATPYPGRVAMLAIARPRAELYARIDQRAGALFAGGLLDEVAGLLGAGYGPELRPMSGHGYGEAVAVLRDGLPIEDAVAVTARRTRQYAKRQMTWFGRDRRIAWLQAGSAPGDDAAVAGEAYGLLAALLD